MARWLFLLLSISGLVARAASHDVHYARNITALIAPEKLATLGPRGANPRIQKAVAQLEAARTSGLKIEKVAAEAVAIAGYRSAAAKVTCEVLVRNHGIAAKLGCLDAAGTPLPPALQPPGKKPFRAAMPSIVPAPSQTSDNTACNHYLRL